MSKKKRKSIKEIQRALLSNVEGFLSTEGEGNTENSDTTDECWLVELTEKSYTDLSLLASYQGCSVDSLAEMAVGDLLALRHWQLKAAREKLVKIGKEGDEGEQQQDITCEGYSNSQENDRKDQEL